MAATSVTPAFDNQVSLPAVDWAVDVNTGTKNAPTWTRVAGLQTTTLSHAPTTQDDSTSDQRGWGSSLVTKLAWSATLNGLRLRDLTGTGFVPDPGQEYLRLRGRQNGMANVVEVRIFRRDGGDSYRGRAAVSYGDVGGGTEALEPFSVTLTGRGKLAEITNPGDTE